MQGTKGRDVDHAKAATGMTAEHVHIVGISQSLGGLGKKSSAVNRESALKCTTRYILVLAYTKLNLCTFSLLYSI